jgi:dolichyl-phosphate-mannose-protein mannosyltransferase
LEIMNKPRSNNLLTAVVLLGILSLALLLRLDGIRYRMFQDETIYIFQTLSVGRLNFVEINVGIVPILLFCFYGLVYTGGYILGVFQSAQDFLSLYYRDMYPFFLIGRVAECLMGTAAVFMLYLLGKRMWNRTVGLAAAFFMAISYVDVSGSQIARGQAFGAFFIITSFYFIAQIYKRGLIRDYLLAALFGGLAASIRIMALYLLLPLAVAHFSRRCRSGHRMTGLRCFAAAAAGMIGVMVLSKPYYWYQPRTLVDHILDILGILGAVPSDLVYIGSYRVSPLYYLTDGLPMAYGWVMFIVIGCGFAYSFFRLKDKKILILLPGAVAYLIVISRGSVVSFNYLAPVSFLLLLLGSFFVVEGLGRIKIVSRWRSSILCAGIILLGIQPLLYILHKNAVRTLPRTQVVSAEWIFLNVPHGAVVAADSMGEFGPDLKRFPVIDYWIFNLPEEDLNDLYRERTAQETGGNHLLKFFIEHPPYPKYRLFNLGTRESIDLETLKRERVEYVVTSSAVKTLVSKDRTKDRFPDLYQSRQKFYTWLDEAAELINSFFPGEDTVGPKIEIYRVRSEAD